MATIFQSSSPSSIMAKAAKGLTFRMSPIFLWLSPISTISTTNLKKQKHQDFKSYFSQQKRTALQEILSTETSTKITRVIITKCSFNFRVCKRWVFPCLWKQSIIPVYIIADGQWMELFRNETSLTHTRQQKLTIARN